MNEDTLQLIWKHQLYKTQELKTNQDKKLKIISPGMLNKDSGPDFFNARLEIDGINWAGNVELHTSPMDWIRHGHHKDKSYDNVILHVVWEESQVPEEIHDIPILSLKEQVSALFENYLGKLKETDKGEVPCNPEVKSIDPLVKGMWLSRMLIERLERKSEEVFRMLEYNNRDWEETFYQLLGKGFGVKINAQPFEMMCRNTPLKILRKQGAEPLIWEAVLMGQAGFLDRLFSDTYPQEMYKEYSYIRHKYGLEPIDEHIWKFMRIRPSAFPTIRISQFARLLCSSEGFFSRVLDCSSYKTLRQLFQVEAGEYWKTHYRFEMPTKSQNRKLGDSSIDLILINVVAPMMFAYGQYRNLQKFKDLAMSILEEMKPEKNSIIRLWDEVGLTASSSFESQALIELRNEYCLQKKCLNCNIGLSILKQHCQ